MGVEPGASAGSAPITTATTFIPIDDLTIATPTPASLTTDVVETNAEFIQAIPPIGDVTMYDAPAETATEIGFVAGGMIARVTGQSPDGAWWRVICPDDSVGNCWVSADPSLTMVVEDVSGVGENAGITGDVVDTNVAFIQAIPPIGDVTMYDAPAATATEIGFVAGGMIAKVTGQSPDGAWWRVICPDDSVGNCWVSADPSLTVPVTDLPNHGGAVDGEPIVQAQYSNSDFGFNFQYPAYWFGPEEYVSDNSLRVEVGTDIVYPYGTDRTERVEQGKNNYFVVLQHEQNTQNSYWTDLYQSLAVMQDGESVSTGRAMTIRVRAIKLDGFTGFEYISTLSDTAQTEPVYIRQVVLKDDNSNFVSVMGSPSNVEFAGTNWREAFEMVDANNQPFFNSIVESITIAP